MPNRIIHEKACNSPTLDGLSADAERLFWRLTTKCDDYGRFDADPRVLLGACFPLRIGVMKPRSVELWRNELCHKGAIDLYRVGDRVYGTFSHWFDYQRRRESRPKYPGPEAGVAFCGTEEEKMALAAIRRDLPRPAAISRAVIRETRDVSRETAALASGGEAPPPAIDAASPPPSFKIPDSIARALDRASRLCRIPKSDRLRESEWWQAQIRAYPGLDLGACVLKAEAWLVTNPTQAARKRDAAKFLRNWFSNEEAWST